MKKIISALILATTILLVIGGCNVNIYNEDRIHRRGLQFLEEKYGSDINFSINHSFTDELRHNMFITVEGQEDWDVRLTWHFNEEEFRDNYMSWVFREEVDAAFLEVLQEIYGEVKLYNSPFAGQERNHFTLDTTLEEYLTSNIRNAIHAFVPVTPEQVANGIEAFQQQADEDLEKFYEALLERGWRASFTVTYISSEIYDQLNIENIREIASETIYRQRQHYLTGGFVGGLNRVRNWRKGDIEW